MVPEILDAQGSPNGTGWGRTGILIVGSVIFVPRGDWQRDNPYPRRAGVEPAALTLCVLQIQRAWREFRVRLRLHQARTHLKAEGYGCESAPAHASCAAARPQACTDPSNDHLLGDCGGDGHDAVEAVWEEAIAVRQPTVDQMLRAERRWLSQGDKEVHIEQLEVLRGAAAWEVCTACSILKNACNSDPARVPMPLRRQSSDPGVLLAR